DHITAGLFDAAAAQVGHSLPFGPMDHSDPGETGGDPLRVAGIAASHNDDLRAAIFGLRLDRHQALVDKGRANDGSDDDGSGMGGSRHALSPDACRFGLFGSNPGRRCGQSLRRPDGADAANPLPDNPGEEPRAMPNYSRFHLTASARPLVTDHFDDAI